MNGRAEQNSYEVLQKVDAEGKSFGGIPQANEANTIEKKRGIKPF